MIKLICGDCIDEMNNLINEGIKVDLILTDPPYLMNYKTNHRKNKMHEFCSTITNDDNKDVVGKSFELMVKLLKDDGALYCFCQDNNLDWFIQTIKSNGLKIRNILTWIKNNWTAGDLKGAYAKQTEFIIFACPNKKPRHLLRGKRPKTALFYDRVAGINQLHQNQKPVDLLKFLILNSSDEKNIILDSFMGSGSTGVACLQTNRNFIGIELDEKYYQIAQERLSQNTIGGG